MVEEQWPSLFPVIEETAEAYETTGPLAAFVNNGWKSEMG